MPRRQKNDEQKGGDAADAEDDGARSRRAEEGLGQKRGHYRTVTRSLHVDSMATQEFPVARTRQGRYHGRIRIPAKEVRMSATAALIQEFDQESQDHPARARARAVRQAGVEAAREVHVARHARDARGVGSGLHHVVGAAGLGGGCRAADHPSLNRPQKCWPRTTRARRRPRAALTTIGDAGLGAMWAMKTPDGKTIMAMPKGALVRSVAFNHLYHHRGQLSVYLRSARRARAVHLRSERRRTSGGCSPGDWFSLRPPTTERNGGPRTLAPARTKNQDPGTKDRRGRML